MTVLLSTATVVALLGMMLILTSRSEEKKRVGTLIFKIGLLLILLCSYLMTKDYRFILSFMVFTIVDFFLSLTFLSEKIKGKNS